MTKAKEFDPEYYFLKCLALGYEFWTIYQADSSRGVSESFPVDRTENTWPERDKLGDYFNAFEHHEALNQLADYLESIGRVVDGRPTA